MKISFRRFVFRIWLILSLVLTVGFSGYAVNELASEKLVPIVAYHRIIDNPSSYLDFTPQQLETHFEYFKEKGYQPITAAQLVRYQHNPELLPEKPIVITFDDGHKSHYLKVFPLLKKYGWKATFFVYTDVIAEASNILLTWEELREMTVAGMDIQSHTVSHPFLTKPQFNGYSSYLQWLSHELYDSRKIIETKLNQPINLLAYPYGWFNYLTESSARIAGYKATFTVNWGVNRIQKRVNHYKRFVLENNMDLEQIELYLNSRPMELHLVTPRNGQIIDQIPQIKFRLTEPMLDQVELKLRNYTEIIRPDEAGEFCFRGIMELKPGYHMVILKGWDQAGRFYLDSWGFDFQYQSSDLGK